MKIVRTIRVRKENLAEISALDCVRRIDIEANGEIIVHLRPESTEGRLTVRKDEYLIQWETGGWQRCGAEALNLIYKNPGSEAGRQWRE